MNSNWNDCFFFCNEIFIYILVLINRTNVTLIISKMWVDLSYYILISICPLSWCSVTWILIDIPCTDKSIYRHVEIHKYKIILHHIMYCIAIKNWLICPYKRISTKKSKLSRILKVEKVTKINEYVESVEYFWDSKSFKVRYQTTSRNRKLDVFKVGMATTPKN